MKQDGIRKLTRPDVDVSYLRVHSLLPGVRAARDYGHTEHNVCQDPHPAAVPARPQ